MAIFIIFLVAIAVVAIWFFSDKANYNNEQKEKCDIIQRHIDNNDYLWLLENCANGARYEHFDRGVRVLGNRIYNIESNGDEFRPIKYDMSCFRSINFDAVELMKKLTGVSYEKRLRLARMHEIAYPILSANFDYYIFSMPGAFEVLDVAVEGELEVAMKFCFYKSLDSLSIPNAKYWRVYKDGVLKKLEAQILETYDDENEFLEYAHLAEKTLNNIFGVCGNCFAHNLAYEEIYYRQSRSED